MYNRNFFGSKVGQASLASIAAMTAMVVLSSQGSLSAKDLDIAQPGASTPLLVELA